MKTVDILVAGKLHD